MKKVKVPFVDEVEEFNKVMGKSYQNRTTPTINPKDAQFVIDFIQEELAEYKEACEKGDIVEVLDALCDIAYVSLGNGTMLHGLKGHIWKAYQEVQASNMSKSCVDEAEAELTVTQRAKEQGEACHWEKIGNRYVVYRTRDRKVMKSVNYFRPDLKQFFHKEDLK
jgi:predicted HAD superfamily Cof-like phosphohydrolase